MLRRQRRRFQSSVGGVADPASFGVGDAGYSLLVGGVADPARSGVGDAGYRRQLPASATPATGVPSARTKARPSVTDPSGLPESDPRVPPSPLRSWKLAHAS